MEQAVFTTLTMVRDGAGNVLLQNRQNIPWPGLAFPGGHVEPGEPFTEAALREVYEETGLVLDDIRLCGVKQFVRNDGSRYVIFLYRAARFHGRLRSSPEGEVMWAPRDGLERLPIARDMAALLPVFEKDDLNEFTYCEEGGKWTNRLL